MKYFRLLVTLVLLLFAIPDRMSAAAQVDASSPDLAAIPLTPDDLAETGYLLEGGGFIEDPAAVAAVIGSLTGIDLDSSATIDLQRTYMHRLILLFDRLNPGSELLADAITLIHQFDSDDDAETFTADLDPMLESEGEPVGDAEGTWRIVVESADTLVSTVVVENLVVQVFSTDLTGRADERDHAANVDATIERVDEVTSATEPMLSSSVALVDDMKLLTFADAPESHQHYQTRDGTWIPSVGFAEPDPTLDNSEVLEAFESQQVLTLNTDDTIVFQVWMAEFEDEQAADWFVSTHPLATLPTVMFEGWEVTGIEGPFPVRGSFANGERYSGYRDVANVRNRIAFVSIVATGDVVLTDLQVAGFVEHQASCLASPDEPCASTSTADILGTNAVSTGEPSAADGTYTDSTFGWSVDYAEAGWEYSSLEAGVILELQQGRNLASIEPVVNRHGDPAQCLLEEVRLLETLEERAYITLGSDVEDEPVAGNEAGHVWAIYTVEPLADERADQEYTIRIDCYALIEGDASLVVHHSAPRDLWEQESAKGDDLRANIEISGVAAATSDGNGAQVRIVDMMIPRIWIPQAA